MVSPRRRASRLRLLPTGPLQSSPSRPTTIPIRSFQRRRYGRKTKRDDRSSWRIDARVISRSVTMGSSGVVFSTRRRRARASSGETKRKETKRNSQSHAEISKPRRRARGNRSRVTSREDAHVRPTHSAPSRRFSNRSTSRSRGTPRHTGGVLPAAPGGVFDACYARGRRRRRDVDSARRRCVASTVRRVAVEGDGRTSSRCVAFGSASTSIPSTRRRDASRSTRGTSRRVAGRRDVRDPSRGDTDVESSRDPREETTMRSNAPGSRTRARIGG